MGFSSFSKWNEHSDGCFEISEKNEMNHSRWNFEKQIILEKKNFRFLNWKIDEICLFKKSVSDWFFKQHWFFKQKKIKKNFLKKTTKSKNPREWFISFLMLGFLSKWRPRFSTVPISDHFWDNTVRQEVKNHSWLFLHLNTCNFLNNCRVLSVS